MIVSPPSYPCLELPREPQDSGNRRVRAQWRGELGQTQCASKTGKSSLIDIIEYCFGREQCHVSDGVIRQHVAWFGILLDRGDSRIFIARRNPKPPKTRDPDVYYAVGADLGMPERADWNPNIGVSDIEAILT